MAMKRFFEPWAENAPEWRTPTRGGWQHSSDKTDPLVRRKIGQLGRARDGCGHLTDGQAHRAVSRVRPPRQRGAKGQERLEFVLDALAERDAGARDEILDRAGDQDFVGTRQGTDASGDVDGETGEIVAADFALSRVQARSHIDPEGLGGFDDGLGAMNGARRAV